jgi:hypothetical protein
VRDGVFARSDEERPLDENACGRVHIKCSAWPVNELPVPDKKALSQKSLTLEGADILRVATAERKTARTLTRSRSMILIGAGCGLSRSGRWGERAVVDGCPTTARRAAFSSR